MVRFDASAGLARSAKEYILENFLLEVSEYDVIVGYRADDSYFSFAQDFTSGAISYRQLNNAMHLGNLGEQVVLKSQKAFDAVKFVDAKYVNSDKWYVKKAAHDNEARRESRLKRYRKLVGLSQRELAEKTGIPVRTIQQYEQRQKILIRQRWIMLFVCRRYCIVIRGIY